MWHSNNLTHYLWTDYMQKWLITFFSSASVATWRQQETPIARLKCPVIIKQATWVRLFPHSFRFPKRATINIKFNNSVACTVMLCLRYQTQPGRCVCVCGGVKWPYMTVWFTEGLINARGHRLYGWLAVSVLMHRLLHQFITIKKMHFYIYYPFPQFLFHVLLRSQSENNPI